MDVPISVVTGSEDPLFWPYLLESATRYFLNTRVQTLHGARHLALRDRPNQIRDLSHDPPAAAR